MLLMRVNSIIFFILLGEMKEGKGKSLQTSLSFWFDGLCRFIP